MQQVHVKEQGSQALLEMYLQALDLEAFLDNYQAYAKDATRSGLPYERFLLALCEAETSHRKAQKIERAIAAAKFPFVKELSSYDFTAVESIQKTHVLELAQGGYMERAENLLVVGTPGLGKTHAAPSPQTPSSPSPPPQPPASLEFLRNRWSILSLSK